MTLVADLFGTAYLSVEAFRGHSALFGAGMALQKYTNAAEADAKLGRVLQAASRVIDSYCGRKFTPDEITEQHVIDKGTWRVQLNNPPVSEVTSLLVRTGAQSTETITLDSVYIEKQRGFIEVASNYRLTIVTNGLLSSLSEPIIEVVYKTVTTVPQEVALATGYQAAHMINTGFVDATLPPNFGKLDLGGFMIGNRKGTLPTKEKLPGSIDVQAERLLLPFVKMSVA